MFGVNINYFLYLFQQKGTLNILQNQTAIGLFVKLQIMKVEITKAQLKAVISLRDDISAMIGCEDDDDNVFNSDRHWKKQVKFIDTFLKKNGYKS